MLAAAHSHVCTDRAEDPMECVGALPCPSEGTDRTRTRAANGANVRIRRQKDRAPIGCAMLLDFWNNFLEQETSQPIAEAVEFKASVEAGVLQRIGGIDGSRREANTNRDRHRVLGNQVIENRGCIETETVKTDVQAGWLLPFVSSRYVDSDGMNSIWKYLSVGQVKAEGCSGRDRWLSQRVRA